MANSLQTPCKLDDNLKKVNKNSGKWDITFDGEQVIVFIPKFTQIIDEWTSKKLRSKSGHAPTKPELNQNQEADKEKETTASPSRKAASPPIPKNKHFFNKINNPELVENIIRNCKVISDLPQKKVKFNPFMFVQLEIGANHHPEAIFETLKGLIQYWPEIDKPFAYAQSIMKTKNGNYNERDHLQQTEEFKNFVADPKIQSLFQLKRI